MSYYIDRYVKFVEESSWATKGTPNTFPNYLLNFEGAIIDHRVDENIIAGHRDAKSRTYVHREVAAVMRVQPVSARFFEYCLGSVSTASGGSLPATITVGTTLPSITAERVFRPVPSAESSKDKMTLWGLKVDTWELTIEQGEDVILELNFAGFNGTIEDATWNPPEVDYSIEPIAYHEVALEWNDVQATGLRRLVISGNNNLEARYSSSGTLSPTYCCQELREGAKEVSGRFVIDRDLATWAERALSRSEGTIECTISSNYCTVSITLNNVGLDEYREPIAGLDPMEVEIPFVCRRLDSTTPVIVIVQDGSGLWSSLAY